MSIGVEDLGDWRRSHYSKDLTPSLEGEKVRVFGWVSSIRRQGGILFLIIRDRDGDIQVTVKRDKIPSRLFKKFERLAHHTAIGVTGIVKAMDKAPRGAEIIPDEVKILGNAPSTPPFILHGKKLPRIDKRLEVRAIDLRRPSAQAVFKVRQAVLQAIRGHLNREGYVEVDATNRLTK